MHNQIKYAGFWIRLAASTIDSLLILAIITPLLYRIYGADYFTSTQLIKGPADLLITYGLPIAAVILFWRYQSATPGKMALKLKIVDADSLQPLTTQQCLIRYLGYFVSTIPFCLGFLWIAFDKRKQGWHDKLAHTVVIREKGSLK